MADKQPPLPKGAVFATDGLPPLPVGATLVPSDASIPTMSADFESRPIAKKDANKLVEAISAGKAKDFEQFFYGGEKPSETRLGRFNQLMQQGGSDALIGMPVLGEVGPALSYLNAVSDLPSISKLPISKKVASVVSDIGEEIAPYTGKISETASKVGKKIKEFPSKTLGFTSQTDPKAIELAYRIGKEGDPALVKAFKAGKDLELDDYSQMIYNYARKLGLPHEEALKATHYRQDLETGAWNLWNKFKNQNPLGLPGWEKASDAQKLKMAEQAGFDLGSYIPTKKNAKALLGLEGGLGYLASVTPYLKAIVNAKVLPLLGLQSPKLVGEMSYRAGQARRIVPSILKGVDNISGPQAIGALQQINPYSEED